MAAPSDAWMVHGRLPEAPADTEDGAPDAFDETAAGRFACHLCAENRDAAERAEAQLVRANALLRVIARAEQRPARREADEPAYELALIGFAQALAGIKARIEIYFQAVRAIN